MYKDMQGVWVPNPTPPIGLPINCSTVNEYKDHWSCWDYPWDAKWIPYHWPTGPPKPFQTVASVHDVFDTTQAPDELACVLDPMPSSTKLRSMLHNRAVYFVGDSINEQLWSLMICFLQSHYGVKGRVRHERVWISDASLDNKEDEILRSFSNFSCEAKINNKDAIASECYSVNIYCFQSAPDELVQTRVCHALSSYKAMASAAKATYGLLKRYPAIGPRDLIVANDGIHHAGNDPEVFLRVTEWLRAVEHLKEEMGDRLPSIIWRESHAQHFNNSQGTGVWPWADESSCVPITRPRYLGRAELFEAARMPMIRTYNASFSRYMDHPGLKTPYLDCTHWCLPSASLLLWVRLVFHHMSTFIAAGAMEGDGEHHWPPLL